MEPIARQKTRAEIDVLEARIARSHDKLQRGLVRWQSRNLRDQIVKQAKRIAFLGEARLRLAALHHAMEQG